MVVAALLIDLQVDFFAHPRLLAHRARLAANINALTSTLRKAGHPVIWVTQCWAQDLHDAPLMCAIRAFESLSEGTPGAALLPELISAPADYRIVKKRYSPFFGTCLDELLKTIGAKRLIIAGGELSRVCQSSGY
ncbi:MAG: isochorismatase family cysteine hydrolase [Steroidobacteraceae bacterium]